MHSGTSAKKRFTLSLNELSHMLRNKSCLCRVEAMGVKLLLINAFILTDNPTHTHNKVILLLFVRSQFDPRQ